MKKVLSVIFAILVMVSVCFSVTACADEKDKKYDVAMRIKCTDGNVYEFPVGEDEKRIEIPYDGVERKYYVYTYNLPDHPLWSDVWFTPDRTGANVFGSATDKLNRMYYEEKPESVRDKGEYFFSCYADSTSTLWKYRSITLYITVV